MNSVELTLKELLRVTYEPKHTHYSQQPRHPEHLQGIRLQLCHISIQLGKGGIIIAFLEFKVIKLAWPYLTLTTKTTLPLDLRTPVLLKKGIHVPR